LSEQARPKLIRVQLNHFVQCNCAVIVSSHTIRLLFCLIHCEGRCGVVCRASDSFCSVMWCVWVWTHQNLPLFPWARNLTLFS